MFFFIFVFFLFIIGHLFLQFFSILILYRFVYYPALLLTLTVRVSVHVGPDELQRSLHQLGQRNAGDFQQSFILAAGPQNKSRSGVVVHHRRVPAVLLVGTVHWNPALFPHTQKHTHKRTFQFKISCMGSGSAVVKMLDFLHLNIYISN